MTNEILSVIDEHVFSVWFLIGAALVFWMQAGFAMVEAGFTRAKNTGNIIMKNLMDFCIGTVMFIIIGFSLLLGEDMIGLIGKPGFDIFTSYADFDWSGFLFNLVFCATTATIVSGAMAERTKFLSYCMYSAIISALIYPIEAHWIWGNGWLAQMGFHDYAGSCAIHMVGGTAALIGAKILGPRIGKFTKNTKGEITKVNAFPGHNLALGALGVFILWLGWYGFNGAVAVHMLNGIWGTIAVGLFTTSTAPGYATAIKNGLLVREGLFYGGGLTQLTIQLTGVLSVVVWTVVTMIISFVLIKNTIGLRVSEEEEVIGMDAMEHGLTSAYAGFSIMDISNTMIMEVNNRSVLGVDLGESDDTLATKAQKNASVPVIAEPIIKETGMYKVVIIAKLTSYDKLRKAMNEIGVTGMTVTQVMGCGIQKGAGEKYRGAEIDATLLPKVKVEVVVGNIPVDDVIKAAKKTLYTGHIGDGKIFIYNVDRVVKIRTGEEDLSALADVE